MKDLSIDLNLTHSLYYESNKWKNTVGFVKKVKEKYCDAYVYDSKSNKTEQYLKDLSVAENFLHGGMQTYDVCRVFLTEHKPKNMKEEGISDWITMIAYFPELNIVALSFHYSLKNTDTDNIIKLRQSGGIKQYDFGFGKMSCYQLAEDICSALGITAERSEYSTLCEITKIGNYQTAQSLEEAEKKRLYGFITGDEGYEFVSDNLASDRLKLSWSSRDFMRIYAFGQSFLFINLIGTKRHNEYIEHQKEYGVNAYGAVNPYFLMGECPLTVNHGILFSVEFAMTLKALVNNVLSYQSKFYKKKKIFFFLRMGKTRDLRRKIIMVLEKVERAEISEIGQLSAMLLESQHIAPIVEQVKDLLEMLESDLELAHSEFNNVLVFILTVVGLVLALWEIFLSM
ncbi:MAG: hypothetical protein E7588_03290 [Ruminococcaceae bacterium]|nr:hypothetical protein [Oscillospiraceae bacterium]